MTAPLVFNYKKTIMPLISNRKNTKLTARRVSVLLHLMGLVLLILLGSCHEDDSPAPEQAHLKVKIKTEGDQYDAVHLEIQQLWTRTSAGGGKIEANKRVNILGIQKDSIVAGGHVPHGSLQEVMLKVAPTGNEIVIDDLPYALEMPQGQIIAVNIAADNKLSPNENHTLMLHINLSDFIQETAEGKFVINPNLTAVLD
ncbi:MULTISPECIES: DUF4382 domain-containing protein [Sphingobacterium]|uniref:DUF4382 domain-containing protein n=1 Tax=Sphingobacterium TaxID=28453 RepID=UPI00095A0EA2|nr:MULTISPECIES: DUF4382 domain-containing protein [Sphingobacterium]OJZ08066.1 MAG: hypothetical protein BGP15_15705 [Sphingobacterium sp. 40-24]